MPVTCVSGRIRCNHIINAQRGYVHVHYGVQQPGAVRAARSVIVGDVGFHAAKLTPSATLITGEVLVRRMQEATARTRFEN